MSNRRKHGGSQPLEQAQPPPQRRPPKTDPTTPELLAPMSPSLPSSPEMLPELSPAPGIEGENSAFEELRALLEGDPPSFSRLGRCSADFRVVGFRQSVFHKSLGGPRSRFGQACPRVVRHTSTMFGTLPTRLKRRQKDKWSVKRYPSSQHLCEQQVKAEVESLWYEARQDLDVEERLNYCDAYNAAVLEARLTNAKVEPDDEQNEVNEEDMVDEPHNSSYAHSEGDVAEPNQSSDANCGENISDEAGIYARARTALRERVLADLKAHGPGSIETFRRALRQGKQRLCAVKLCFVGHSRAGKTSTLKALAGRAFDPNEASTHGVATRSFASELLNTTSTRVATDTVAGLADGATPWAHLEMNDGDRSVTNDGVSGLGRLLAKGIAHSVARELLNPESSIADPVSAGPESASGTLGAEAVAPEPQGRGLRIPLDLIVSALKGPCETTLPLVLQAWDFAGQELYYDMAHLFLTSPAIYVLVLDLSDWVAAAEAVEARERMDFVALNSFSDPAPLADTHEKHLNGLNFWLASLYVHASESRLLIVGTHDDIVPEHLRFRVRQLVDDHLASRLQKMPSMHRLLCVNEADQLNFFPIDNRRSTMAADAAIRRLRASVDAEAREQARELNFIPTRWAHLFHVISSDLLSQCWRDGVHAAVLPKHHGCTHVSLEDCCRLAEPLGFEGKHEVQACLALFHSLGQLIYFPGSPAVVLDPQWLLDAMAQVADCKRVLRRYPRAAAALRGRGELEIELLEFLWEDVRFKGHLETLREFLEHFGLLIPNPDGRSTWIAPTLLPPRHQSLIQQSELVLSATLLLDFHGALQGLLPWLLPRLVCELRRLMGHTQFRVLAIYRDAAVLSMSGLLVRLEATPSRAPEMLSVSTETPDGREVVGKDVQLVLDAVASALTCITSPSHVTGERKGLPFVARMRCPACGGDYQSGGHGHYLNLSELLSEELIFCPALQQLVLDKSLPQFARDWRRRVAQGSRSQQIGLAQPSTKSARTRLQYLFASPFVLSRHATLPPLDISHELRMLCCMPGLCVDACVATAETLRGALLSRCDGQVLHISAHCDRGRLILEDGCGAAHLFAVEDLVRLGPWGGNRLLLLLACGSERLVRALSRRSGLKFAICCTGEVFDAAARLFSKAFYQALQVGHSPKVGFHFAQNAVRDSLDAGLRQEYSKFIFVASDSAPTPEPWSPKQIPIGMVPMGLTGESKSHAQQLRPRVDDFIGRHFEMVAVAAYFERRGASHRRAVLLWGQAGLGKTSFCKEFAYHFALPGRLFSSGAFIVDCSKLRGAAEPSSLVDTFARAAAFELRMAIGLEVPTEDSVAGARVDWGTRSDCPHIDPLQSLMTLVRQFDAVAGGLWLMVADSIEAVCSATLEELSSLNHCGTAIVGRLLGELLSCTVNLCILFTAREPLHTRGFASLGDSKVVNIGLQGLGPKAAARLFLSRLGRPLFPSDFGGSVDAVNGTDERNEPCWPNGLRYGGAALKMEVAIDRVMEHPLMLLANGVPGRITAWAGMVNDSLPSLSLHPGLQANG